MNQPESILTKALPQSFYKRPSQIVGPDLIGCRLIKRQSNGELLWGIIVETEAYSQDESACHGFHRRTPNNETLFGQPGRFYVYRTYGIYYCVNVVTDRADWASGVLLRAIAIPQENERAAAGPGLLARHFDLNKSHDNLPISIENGLWLAEKSRAITRHKIVNTTRIGISKAQELPWRWYLQACRSVSKRAKGDRLPELEKAWDPARENYS